MGQVINFHSSVSWTDVMTAFGTVGAVVVALFGQFLPKLLPPKLRVGLVDAVGTKQLVQVMMTGGALPVPAFKMWTRYYRIQVSNRRRWAKAHNVQVILLRIEQETTAGWTDVPNSSGSVLAWQGQDHNSAAPVRPIGRPAAADLFQVVQDRAQTSSASSLQLTPLSSPVGAQLKYDLPCRLRLTVQAFGDEADSNQLTVTVGADGQWHDGTAEMAQHVRLEAT